MAKLITGIALFCLSVPSASHLALDLGNIGGQVVKELCFGQRWPFGHA